VASDYLPSLEVGSLLSPAALDGKDGLCRQQQATLL